MSGIPQPKAAKEWEYWNGLDISQRGGKGVCGLYTCSNSACRTSTGIHLGCASQNLYECTFLGNREIWKICFFGTCFHLLEICRNITETPYKIPKKSHKQKCCIYTAVMGCTQAEHWPWYVEHLWLSNRPLKLLVLEVKLKWFTTQQVVWSVRQTCSHAHFHLWLSILAYRITGMQPFEISVLVFIDSNEIRFCLQDNDLPQCKTGWNLNSHSHNIVCFWWPPNRYV